MLRSTIIHTSPLLALLAMLSAPALAQSTLPPGTPISEALAVDITEYGFNTVMEELSTIVPPELTIPAIAQQEMYSIPWVCDPQYFWAENLVIHTEIDQLLADAREDSLLVTVAITLTINSPSNPAQVILDGPDGGCLDYVCNLHSDPAVVTVDLPLTFSLGTNAEGDPALLLDIGEYTHNLDSALDGKVHLTDCAVGSINEVLDLVGLNIIDYAIGQFVGDLDDTLAETFADLEATVAESSTALWLNDTTTVLDAELSYDISPTAVEHEDDGLRLVMGGSVDAPPHPCVADYDTGEGSHFTMSDLPALDTTIPGSAAYYDAGAKVSDDFLNQALYAAWRGGVMCFVIDKDTFAMDSSYLGLMLGQDYAEQLEELFPDGDVPMLVRTVPSAPPVASFDGELPVTIQIDGLNIEFYPLMYGRFVRLVSVAIDLTVGVDAFVDSTDALALDISIDSDNLNPRVTYNEIAPELDEAFAEAFPSFFATILNTVGGSMLEGMAFALPTMNGLGLSELQLHAIGSPNMLDWLGAYATIGESTGGVSSGGCDSCSSGCSACTSSDGTSCAEGDIDLQACLDEQGCAGDPTNPSDTGCGAASPSCGYASHAPGVGHWRLVLDPDGAVLAPIEPKRRLPFSGLLAVLGPVLFLMRRRRGAGERRAS